MILVGERQEEVKENGEDVCGSADQSTGNANNLGKTIRRRHQGENVFDALKVHLCWMIQALLLAPQEITKL